MRLGLTWQTEEIGGPNSALALNSLGPECQQVLSLLCGRAEFPCRSGNWLVFGAESFRGGRAGGRTQVPGSGTVVLVPSGLPVYPQPAALTWPLKLRP